MTYFNLSTDIVDRTDLTTNQKMACVVMARYANRKAFEGLLSVSVIAQKMGVSEAVAEQTISQLAEKGLLIPQFNLTALKEQEVRKQVPTKKSSDPLDDLTEIFDEVVSRTQLRILFGLADRKVDVLKDAYSKVREQCSENVIEVLAEYLQTGKLPDDVTSPKTVDSENGIIADRPITEQESAALFEAFEVDQAVATSGQRLNNQINMNRVKALYKANKKK